MLEYTNLYLFKRNFEAERFVVVRIQRTLLDGRLLLANPLPVQHQRQLHVRVYNHSVNATTKCK